jgi:hypothetical protein
MVQRQTAVDGERFESILIMFCERPVALVHHLHNANDTVRTSRFMSHALVTHLLRMKIGMHRIDFVIYPVF